MSIIETDKIDAIGISKDGEGLILMLADHLDWKNEAEHLTLLLDKINAYLGFIESNQHSDTYPERVFEYFVIDVRFKYKATENCLIFFEVINSQLREYKIQVIKNED
ncbi:DUF6572 domain-containing protein [Solibacillus sp. FSL K6-1523]|uniref:DUF6572 domain-containing protein n=1 Tax=Solibacillus sp. FSL K6-1523 TaxID=2921471 RepID=UPI0030FAD3BE